MSRRPLSGRRAARPPCHSLGRPLRSGALQWRPFVCNSAMAVTRGAYGAEVASGLSVSL